MSRLTELWLSGASSLADTASQAGRRHHLAGRPSNNRHTPENFADRFWRKVDRRGPDDCWAWLGNRLPSGRGQVHIKWSATGSNVRKNAPVVAWELTHGRTVPAGLVIAHSCDCPNCVNPKHLSAVTQAENIHESIRKGRYNVFGRQRLNADQVRQIRVLASHPERQTYKLIGQRFGVSRGCVTAIVRGETWAHLA